jgi:hypothetical protein
MFFHTNQFIDAAAPTMSNPLKQLFGFETDGHQPLCKTLELFREPHKIFPVISTVAKHKT